MTPISRRLYAVGAVILAAVIFVMLNIAADTALTGSRIDLTENGLFTLSQGTKNIIARLPEPVTLKFGQIPSTARTVTSLYLFVAEKKGYFAVENKVEIHDLHATMLHLLGVDHTKLTYRFGGRDFRLTDVFGHVIRDVIA